VSGSSAVVGTAVVLNIACADSEGGDSMLVVPSTATIAVGAMSATVSVTAASMNMPLLHCTFSFASGDARFAGAAVTTNVFSVVTTYTPQSSSTAAAAVVASSTAPDMMMSSTGGSNPGASTGLPASASMLSASWVASASMLFALVALLL
jgi:hypothetical protein